MDFLIDYYELLLRNPWLTVKAVPSTQWRKFIRFQLAYIYCLQRQSLFSLSVFSQKITTSLRGACLLYRPSGSFHTVENFSWVPTCIYGLQWRSLFSLSVFSPKITTSLLLSILYAIGLSVHTLRCLLTIYRQSSSTQWTKRILSSDLHIWPPIGVFYHHLDWFMLVYIPLFKTNLFSLNSLHSLVLSDLFEVHVDYTIEAVPSTTWRKILWVLTCTFSLR